MLVNDPIHMWVSMSPSSRPSPTWAETEALPGVIAVLAGDLSFRRLDATVAPMQMPTAMPETPTASENGTPPP
jgi:hypothetical protein